MPPSAMHYEDWFCKARNDLMAAKAIVEYYEEPPTDTICYHCHQVVEKGLKGFLIYHGVELLKVHDLVDLINSCSKLEPELGELKEDIEILGQYYIEAKYPLDLPINYSLQEAKEAVGKAESVLKILLKTIEK